MPTVKKTIKKNIEPKGITTPVDNCCTKKCGCFASEFGRKLILTLIAILSIYLICYIGTLINNNLKKGKLIGQADKQERTILITGYGKMVSSNNIAVTAMGYSNTDKDISIAQANNKKVMDAVLSELKSLGIADEDVLSNYSVYPQYSYEKSEQKFTGYQISHQLNVKIRNLNNIQKVLDVGTKHGINKVSGIKFTIDDRENLKNKARVAALEDANKKAKVIASKLGVTIERASGYNEYEINQYGAYALGGSGLSTSSSDVEMSVNVTYSIK